MFVRIPTSALLLTIAASVLLWSFSATATAVHPQPVHVSYTLADSAWGG
ncbi:hypothetical protein ACSCBZ_12425 [Streptomyces niveiscabiei]|uniref:Secreted protein n=1 Tax=Streptomyces niveiscabiei TaxID=164115 RepID=A0ABW9I1R2_9ACTN|nr:MULTISPECIES: hypothetical protein [Streptomyces]QZZ31524.1 hypothetical protein A7X85_39680 [Streptomyces sp. ST1015]